MKCWQSASRAFATESDIGIHFPCGSGLARESGLSDTMTAPDTAPSRASPLPQGIALIVR
ncbi:hypothetical protein FHG55_00230 [Pseudomonas jessenii]|uniref:Uncharacterized protein n=1 Tax=Pseudomonas jessenii TaxID=77298 RepID=A0A5C4L3X1_PSEJE|nr:hypothetical protein FHG55_00230 [Pseudomonas jessenii]